MHIQNGHANCTPVIIRGNFLDTKITRAEIHNNQSISIIMEYRQPASTAHIFGLNQQMGGWLK